VHHTSKEDNCKGSQSLNHPTFNPSKLSQFRWVNFFKGLSQQTRSGLKLGGYMRTTEDIKIRFLLLAVLMALGLCDKLYAADPAVEMDTSHVIRARNLSKDAYELAVALTEAPVPPLQLDREVCTERYTVFPFFGDVRGSRSCIGAIYSLITLPLNNMLIIATRGTMYSEEKGMWGRDVIADLNFFQQSALAHNLPGEIHGGFSDIVESCYHSFYEKITRARNHLRGNGLALNETQIIFTGHSLGAALATIIAPRFVNHNNSLPIAGRLFPHLSVDSNRAKIINFSSPNVGDIVFHNGVISLISSRNILHFNCGYDIVSYVPPTFLGFQPIGITIQTFALERMADRGIFPRKWSFVSLLFNAHEAPEVATLRRAFECFKRSGTFSYQPSVMDVSRNPILKILKPFFC